MICPEPMAWAFLPVQNGPRPIGTNSALLSMGILYREMGKWSSTVTIARSVGFGWCTSLRANWTVVALCLVDVRGILGISCRCQAMVNNAHIQ